VRSEPAYLPIAEHGVIGDQRSTARAYGRLSPMVEQASEQLVSGRPARRSRSARPAESASSRHGRRRRRVRYRGARRRAFVLERGDRATQVGEAEAERLMHVTARARRAWLGRADEARASYRRARAVAKASRNGASSSADLAEL
jgi:hypothetical protein